MEASASSVVEIQSSLKRSRDELKPLREQLVSDMLEKDVNKITVGNIEIQLVAKKARKNVSAKKMLALIKTELGEEATKTIASKIEEVRGDTVTRHSIKLVDA